MSVLDQLADALNSLFNSRQLRHDAWRRFAAERHGVFHEPSGGFFSSRDASMDVPSKDALVHVDTYVVRSNNSSTTYTRFRAAYLLQTGPRFKVYKANFFGDIGTALGFEDVELGDAAFDQAFIVRSSDVAGARIAWTDAARRAMHTLGRGSVVSDGSHLKYITTGAIRDPAVLSRATELLGALASYGEGWFSVVRSLPNATYTPPRGRYDSRTVPSVRVVERGTEVQIYPSLDHLGLTMVAATLDRRSLPPFTIRFAEKGDPLDPLPPEIIPPDAKAGLRRVAPFTLSHDGNWIRVTFHGPESQRRLKAGVELAVQVAGGGTSQGAFR
ncbi:MAG: hypothetical protein AAGF12_00560 [Myxococcota bacterium]